jgi:hypothetical protein
MSKETKKAEQIEQNVKGAELSDQDLEGVAGGIAVADQAQPSKKKTKPVATGSTTGSVTVTPVGSGG